MTPRDQARAVVLLRRWRDACRFGGGSELEDELANLTGLFLETDAFLNYEELPIVDKTAAAS